jgi:hypothetical protein
MLFLFFVLFFLSEKFNMNDNPYVCPYMTHSGVCAQQVLVTLPRERRRWRLWCGSGERRHGRAGPSGSL